MKYAYLSMIFFCFSKCFNSHEKEITNQSIIFYNWFLSEGGMEVDIPPKVLWEYQKCGNKIILTQIPDSSAIGNVIYLGSELEYKYPDTIYNWDFIDSIQMEYITQNKNVAKAYSMDTAYWIYSENPIFREGPYTLEEINRKIKCK